MSRYSTTLPASAFPGATINGGIITADGLRRSISRPTEIINANQIPAGAEVIRIDNPPQYHHHQPVVQETFAYPVPQPGCCEQISPCCVGVSPCCTP